MTEFERIVLPHLGAGHNLARWLVSDTALAEDIVQEAALRAMHHFGSYRGGDARAWFLQIVRNGAYDALGRRKRDRAASLDQHSEPDDAPALQIPDPADDPEASLSRREGHAWLEMALAALPADLRECLVLRELEEMSYKQIAQVTGAPIGTVMSRLWRARQALLRGQGAR